MSSPRTALGVLAARSCTMDSHQREPFLDCSNSKFDVLSLLCGQETSPQCSSSLLGSLRPADDQLCGLQDPLDILPGASLDGSDLDPMHEAHDYSAQWEENDHSDLGQYTYCTPSPDSSDSFLACLDHYDSSTPLCPSLSAELDEPTTPSEKCAAAAALEEPGSRLELRQRSRARAKFTQDEDQLIMHLRKKRETWKSIAKKIPGRSPGALQVRFSTKLKFKTVDWEKGLVCTILSVHFLVSPHHQFLYYCFPYYKVLFPRIDEDLRIGKLD